MILLDRFTHHNQIDQYEEKQVARIYDKSYVRIKVMNKFHALGLQI